MALVTDGPRGGRNVCEVQGVGSIARWYSCIAAITPKRGRQRRLERTPDNPKANRSTHLAEVRDVDPRTPDGCEKCLAIGSDWMHMRLCLSCGHVGCCDQSQN